MSVLLTLPPHLLEKVRAILAADLGDQLDPALRADLKKAQLEAEGYDTEEHERSEASHQDISTPMTDDHSSSAHAEGSGPTQAVVAPPPTINEDTLIALSRWAARDIGPALLKRNDLDPLAYSLISLLAGTEVYVSPDVLARLRAAENPDKVRLLQHLWTIFVNFAVTCHSLLPQFALKLTDQPNPFLPAYLSPQPPSLGSEYRTLTRNLSTALNILFSIFGSAGAVYAAGVSGAGYTRETSMLLAILAGAVVGIADGVLVWIFSERVGKGREEGRRLGREMLKGSAVPVADKGQVDDDEVEDPGGASGSPETGFTTKTDIRLRRRAIGQHKL